MDIIRPGLHWDAVHMVSHRVLVRGFQKLGIFKSPDSPGGGSWASEEAILASGVSTAFYPHGLGHSLGMDVHDVPTASKPAVNPSIADNTAGLQLGHPNMYEYLRLRLKLEAGMVVVRASSHNSVAMLILSAPMAADRRAGHLLLPASPCQCTRLAPHRPRGIEALRERRWCADRGCGARHIRRDGKSYSGKE